MGERKPETDEQMRAYWTNYIDSAIEDVAAFLQEGGKWAGEQHARWMWLRERVGASAAETSNG